MALAASNAADEQPFVGGLSDAEREQIGLANLTPAQIAALEAAVQRYVDGRSEEVAAEAKEEARAELSESLSQKDEALVAAQSELAAAQAQLEAKQAELKEKEASEGQSLLQRAKVLLTPGTKIEYATVNSTLLDEFKGWNVGTLFRLENGQTWRVIEGKYWSPREDAGKAVSVEPGVLGSFFIRIEGVRQTPRVELVSRN